ncbi:hypothetical protein SteCoe_29350 [Stentor coeruleus]|uniref:TRAFD1/XAF1 zinc finger domain-containing protein n=1 Tax=Stentor coeruleus TaxID=5963 RepID=A0A1R2B633_9CILI|nr:hypothetical protein SteCoe_29350 [Stentor coeruleus]
MPDCPNCKKDIPSEIFELHEAHCSRFIVLCTQCKQSIPKIKKKDHDKEFHKKAKCPYCSESIDITELPLHKTICNAKPRPCLYCGAIMDLQSLLDHEDHCGSRTEACDICGKNIVIKDLPEHFQNCIEMMEEQEHKEQESLKKKKNNHTTAKKRGKK